MAARLKQKSLYACTKYKIYFTDSRTSQPVRTMPSKDWRWDSGP